MPAARYARLVRFCDERYTARADGLASAARHFEQSRFKSQSNDAAKRQGWPSNGLPLVAVGSHAARGLVMFGVCKSTAWTSNPEPADAEMYPSVIDVAWERTIFEVDPDRIPEPTRAKLRRALSRGLRRVAPRCAADRLRGRDRVHHGTRRRRTRRLILAADSLARQSGTVR